MPVVHPADVWRASGRFDAVGPGADPVQGSQRPGHGPGDDPRGGRRPAPRRHRQVLAPAPAAGLPLPDQVARRAAGPGRADPRPRVRDEGRLQLRPRRGRASTPATGPSTAHTSGSSSGSASTRSPVSSDVGMMGGSLAHEFMVLNPAGEDVLVLCEACGYAANRQVAVIPRPDPAPEDAAPLEEVETPGHDDHRVARRVPRHRTGANGQGRLLRDRRRPPGHRDRARRSRGQRDEARQRGRGQGRRPPARDGRGDQGGRHGARLRLADRRPRHGRRRGRPRRRAHRTWSRARTGWAGTTAT